jgi:hypothetical protein
MTTYQDVLSPMLASDSAALYTRVCTRQKKVKTISLAWKIEFSLRQEIDLSLRQERRKLLTIGKKRFLSFQV